MSRYARRSGECCQRLARDLELFVRRDDEHSDSRTLGRNGASLTRTQLVAIVVYLDTEKLESGERATAQQRVVLADTRGEDNGSRPPS